VPVTSDTVETHVPRSNRGAANTKPIVGFPSPSRDRAASAASFAASAADVFFDHPVAIVVIADLHARALAARVGKPTLR
jgi:hypothetical protein